METEHDLILLYFFYFRLQTGALPWPVLSAGGAAHDERLSLVVGRRVQSLRRPPQPWTELIENEGHKPLYCIPHRPPPLLDYFRYRPAADLTLKADRLVTASRRRSQADLTAAGKQWMRPDASRQPAFAYSLPLSRWQRWSSPSTATPPGSAPSPPSRRAPWTSRAAY